MNPDVIVVKLVGVEYHGFYFDKLISKGKSAEKVLKKLHAYVKSQS